MEMQEVYDGEDAKDARAKWNDNFKKCETKIQQNLQNTFVDTSDSSTNHTFNIVGIQSYEDIKYKVISFLLPQASGTLHKFNVNGYGEVVLLGVNTSNGATRDLIKGEVVANKILLTYYNGTNFILINGNPQIATKEQAQATSNIDDSNYMTSAKVDDAISGKSVKAASKINGVIVDGNVIKCYNMTRAEAATYGGAGKIVELVGSTG